eukprot:SAG31_NODE_12720_length_921_cov_2.321168_2_plen_82_part_00
MLDVVVEGWTVRFELDQSLSARCCYRCDSLPWIAKDEPASEANATMEAHQEAMVATMEGTIARDDCNHGGDGCSLGGDGDQ